MLNGVLEEFKRSHGNALTPFLILLANDVRLYVGTEQLLVSGKNSVKIRLTTVEGTVKQKLSGIISRFPSIN